jgi:hypothetical protein
MCRKLAKGLKLFSVTNMFQCPRQQRATLDGYLGLNTALWKGALDARPRAPLAVAEINA